MAKDPAFLFYSNDFLTGTYTMTDKQVGQYIRLLCLQHQTGRLTEKQMLSICKRKDADIWAKFLQDENGLYYNKKLAEEMQRRQAHREKQRENIFKRWNKNGIESGNTTVLPLETETETITNISKGDKGLKGKRGEFKNVLLTDEEYSKLCERFTANETDKAVEELSSYMRSKGKSYKDHYATLINWIKRNAEKKPKNENPFLRLMQEEMRNDQS
jgi:hypothetical protein